MRSSSLLLALAACATAPTVPMEPAPGSSVQLAWTAGQTFHVASTDALMALAAPADAIALDGDMPEAPDSATWTPEHVWTYQVVEADLVPTPDDALHPFSVDAAGRAVPLTVLRASLDPALNPPGALLASDPVVYLVFRAERNRLAGVVQFTTDGGARREQSWSASRLDGAVGLLTQSHMALAPTYLAPTSARWIDDEHALEDGSLVTSVRVEDDVVDVFFDDELGGQLVTARYEAGEPWPTWTHTAGHESRLLSPDEVEARRDATLAAAGPPPPGSADYRAALAAAPDLDAARRITPEQLADGRIAWRTAEGRTPWAGYWWPTRSAELVFGYDGRPTFAGRIRDELDPIKSELDALAANGKYVEWGRRNADLRDLVVGHYDGIHRRLEGGWLWIEGGRVVGTGPDEQPWDYALDDLSPMDKWGLVQWLRRDGTSNPFLASAWEIMNSYTPEGEGWWGHCNGWAGAAILTQQPAAPRTVDAGGVPVTFTTADQKGLLTEMHLGVSSNFFGARYPGGSSDVNDLSPEAFFTVMGHFLGDRGVSVVVDAEATEAVWNYPVAAVDVALTPLEDRSGRLDVNGATLDELLGVPGIDEDQAIAVLDLRAERGAISDLGELAAVPGLDVDALAAHLTVDPVARVVHADIDLVMVTDGVSPTHVDAVADAPATESRRFGATLSLAADGRILSGTWDDPTEHPDFAWAPYANATAWADSRAENQFLKYGDYLEVIGADAVER